MIRQNNKEGKNTTNVNDNLILEDKNRLLFLGDNGWVYIKLYGAINRSDEILSLYIPELIDKLNNPKHFFIRYDDEIGKHLRVRFKFMNEQEAIEQLHNIIYWAKDLVNKRLINNVVFDTYERESNRYGGAHVIQECEKVFFADSVLVENILKQYDMSNEKEMEKCYINGISLILKGITNNIEEMFSIIDSRKYGDEFRKEYRKKNKLFFDFVDHIISGDMDEVISVQEASTELIKKLKAFKEVLDVVITQKTSTNSRESIVFSLIHMHCNRLTGRRDYENKYLELTRDTLYHLVKKEQHKK